MSEVFFKQLPSYLTLPGQGVHTVHTGAELKQKLWQQLYQSQDAAQVEIKWKQQLAQVNDQSILLFGICSDSGGGIQRGANWGPLYLRMQLQQQGVNIVTDLGDIKVIPHLLHDKYLNQSTLESCRLALYADAKSKLPVSPLSMAEHLCQQLWQSSPRQKLFMMGGDHSVSYPVVSQWLLSRAKQKINAAVIHFDAHTDLLAHRLGIDFNFGSWAYHILPLLSNPSNLVQIGIRASAEEKQHWQNKFGLKQYWADDFRQQKLDTIAAEITQHLTKLEVEEIYISCDIDALDASYASATGTPESGGMEPHQIIYLINHLSSHFKITAADLVEVAPKVTGHQLHQLNPEPQTTLSNAGLIIQATLEAMQTCR